MHDCSGARLSLMLRILNTKAEMRMEPVCAAQTLHLFESAWSETVLRMLVSDVALELLGSMDASRNAV